jgi:dolichol-phosphate mannosyltransferase
VVVPALNESDTISELVERASRHAPICVIDDCSSDGTAELAEAAGAVHVVRHTRNTHIAGAILDGFRYALDAGYTHCITMDAGLSHDPDAIPAFLSHRDADLVVGYRQEVVNVPIGRRLLSWGGNRLMNLALERRSMPWGGARLRDVTSGYRMYSRRAFEMLTRAPMGCRAFDFHIESLAWIYRAGMRIEETPIRYEFTNSSLKAEIVREALATCRRIWSSELEMPSNRS